MTATTEAKKVCADMQKTPSKIVRFVVKTEIML